MARSELELADIVRAHGREYLAARGDRATSSEKAVLHAIEACRTAALGGHLSRCNSCGHQEISYNSCRNRHCPRCQAAARLSWLEEQERDLLPVEYFHVVFTVPKEIGSLALGNKKAIYRILFAASWQSVDAIASDAKHLGAKAGMLAVLHTWGQNLQHHPHVHCVVPGGGLSPDGSQWIPCRKGFFLPVRVLGRMFRGRFLTIMRAAHQAGEIRFGGAARQTGLDFNEWLNRLWEKEWVVYAKPPFGGPAHVLRYLARYTHRVAISNSRLLEMADGKVTFLWKDYANGSRRSVMTLTAVEFLRRFLLHVLPKGFQRIRRYGFLANRCRREQLDRCRRALDAPVPDREQNTNTDGPPQIDHPCPACRMGALVVILSFEPGQRINVFPTPAIDSS